MNYVSTFTGIGGFDLAFDRAGLTCAAQVEKDAACRKLLARHWPDVKRFDDVKEFGRADLAGAVDVVCGGSPCFPAGTLVLTSDGYLPIESVKEGATVLTHQNRWRPVTKTMSRMSETVTLVGRGNSQVVTTPDHPFFSRTKKDKWFRKGGKRERKLVFSDPEFEAAEKMTGKYWASPCNIPESPIPDFQVLPFEHRPSCQFTPEFFWFVGAWLGDGWATRTKRAGRKNQTNGKVCLCANFRQASEIADRLQQAGLDFTRTDFRTAAKFFVFSKSLTRWLLDNFGQGAGGKHIPAWALGMPVELKRALLDGYFYADGHAYAGHKKATTISKALAHGIKLMSQCSGFSTMIGMYIVNPTTVIEGRTVNQRTQWQIACYDKSTSQFRLGDFIWGRVRSVKHGEEKKVYNLSVADDESYIADGVVVHNCQDVSVAGAGAGLAGERSGLYFEFARIVNEFTPRWFVFENVPGLLASNGGLDFALVIGGFTGVVPSLPRAGWKNSGLAWGPR